ncbi:MAG: type IV pilus assembly protein PilM [Candidatus Tectomicrobia bacterium]|uniref:Type IV pilus assembly protein PilM n=1 Tax=Tectimicrobiota bacterium TaxID=2528274 RepID=A0A932CNJ5_UNCTE|nr:type IV pilus assembly protein PilM [Candidatus Tectomicrobia bacterium]
MEDERPIEDWGPPPAGEGGGGPSWQREILPARAWTSSLLGWRQGRVQLGLDLGSHALKAVLVERSSKRTRLLSFALVELPMVAGEPQGAQLQALAEAFESLHLRGVEIVTAVESSRAIMKQLTLPAMSPKEMEQAMPWEARRYIPFDLEDVALDYQVLRKEKDARDMEVFLVAIPRSQVESHLEILRAGRIDPAWTGVSALALMNAFLAGGGLRPEETVVLIDLGAETTTLNVYREGEEFFTRSIAIAGNAFSVAIQESLGIPSLAQAEARKRKPEPGDDLWRLIASPFSELVLELRRSLTFYDNRTGRRGLDRLLLTGGGARLQGIDQLLERELDLPVEVYHPLRGIEVVEAGLPCSSQTLEELSPQLSLALGLTWCG